MSDMLPVAAVQIQVKPGRLADNLAHVEQLAGAAFSGGAKLVALPEFFTSALITGAPVADAVVPAAANPALDLLKSLAKKYHGFIGGSFLVAEQEQVFNRYHFVQPDGQVFTHDKDLPTMWENAFYTRGSDDGVFQTELGGIGAAVCWELIREQTVARMKGRVGVAMTGTHWWSMPENWSGVGRLLGAIGQYNRYLSEQAPVEFARRLGVPVLQASHCGPITGDFYLCPGVDWKFPYNTCFVGATQIVSAQGQVLASRNTMQGPGIVQAEIELGAVEPVLPADPARYWILQLPLFLRLYWHHQNATGRSMYRRSGRAAGLDGARQNDNDNHNA